MKALTRQTDGYKFYSNVYTSKEEAQAGANSGNSSAICFTKYGDHADGWMNFNPFNQPQEDSVIAPA